VKLHAIYLHSYFVWGRVDYVTTGVGFVDQLRQFFWVRSRKEVWRLVLLCLMWCLWRERNTRHFEDIETLVLELRKILLNTLYIWIAAHHSLSVFTFANFLNLCSSLSSYLGFSCILSVY
jgi:hypothetical protein